METDLGRLADAFERHIDSDKGQFEAAKERDDAILSALEDLQTTLKPISDAYNGFLFSKSFIVGLSSVILAIGAIGAGIIAFGKFLK